jgi:hypothetical protein
MPGPLARACARLLAAALPLALAACASLNLPTGASGPPAPAPTFKVGDRWTYHGREGYRLPVEWDETHEVTAIGPEGITVRVTYGNSDVVSGSRTELWAAPGVVKAGALMDIETRRFATPVTFYKYPMTNGEQWNEWVDNYNETTKREGRINRYTRVGGYERMSTPMGEQDVLRLRVLMRLDDDTFWRDPTTCNYLLFYAPALGVTVREERDAEYVEKGSKMDAQAVRAQHTVLLLTSFKRAP